MRFFRLQKTPSPLLSTVASLSPCQPWSDNAKSPHHPHHPYRSFDYEINSIDYTDTVLRAYNAADTLTASHWAAAGRYIRFSQITILSRRSSSQSSAIARTEPMSADDLRQKSAVKSDRSARAYRGFVAYLRFGSAVLPPLVPSGFQRTAAKKAVHLFPKSADHVVKRFGSF